MEEQKKQLKKMMTTRSGQDAAYQSAMMALIKYEEVNLEFYSESDL